VTIERCWVCGADDLVERWTGSGRGAGTATESGVDPAAFLPSADQFGRTVSAVISCRACGHGVVSELPRHDAVANAYLEAADPVSLREEAGQIETARRALARIERWARPGRLLEVGSWTGSFLVAALERGWKAEGIEPSQWAVARARERGLEITDKELDDVDLDDHAFDAIVACDVLEHLADPGAALERFRHALAPTGVLFVTVPDAGSRLAKVLGRRWWSVLPMHLQYFTRESITIALREHGFDVVEIRSHPKLFTVRYYAERFTSFVPGLGSIAARATGRSRFADRLVAPDFHDRMAVIAKAR